MTTDEIRGEKEQSMIISHKKKFIYFHVYKVAGTSIRKALKEHDDLSFSDFPFHKNIQFFIGHRIWFLSSWAVDHLKASEAKYYLPENTFNNYFKFSFVRNPWDWQVSIYHYMMQYKFHPQHRLVAKMKTFDEYIEWRIEYDLELQKEFIYDKKGKMLVDFVGRYRSGEHGLFSPDHSPSAINACYCLKSDDG